MPIAPVEKGRCNCTAIRKASRRVSQLYDSCLAPAGLKSTQYAILNEIYRRADELPTLGELAEALVMDSSTMGQNLRPLERDGLVSLVEDASDRRRRNVGLTKKGRAVVAAARPLWEQAQQRFESHFGREVTGELRTLLLRIAGDERLGEGWAGSPT